MGRHHDDPTEASVCPARAVCTIAWHCTLGKQEACRILQEGLVCGCYLCRKRGTVCEDSWNCWKKRGMMFPEKDEDLCLTAEPPCGTVEPVV